MGSSVTCFDKATQTTISFVYLHLTRTSCLFFPCVTLGGSEDYRQNPVKPHQSTEGKSSPHGNFNVPCLFLVVHAAL